VNQVIQQTENTMREVHSTKQLEDWCVGTKSSLPCVLLYRGAKLQPFELQWIKRLTTEFRKVKFAWVDSKVFKLSIESSLPKVDNGQHRMVLFKKTQNPSDKDDTMNSGRTTLTAKAYRSYFDYLAVESFLQENLPQDLKILNKKVVITKRERKSPNAKTSKDPESKNTPPGENSQPKKPTAQIEQELREKMNRESEQYFPQPNTVEGISLDTTDDEEEVLDLDED